jgi:hypothetical protein
VTALVIENLLVLTQRYFSVHVYAIAQHVEEFSVLEFEHGLMTDNAEAGTCVSAWASTH